MFLKAIEKDVSLSKKERSYHKATYLKHLRIGIKKIRQYLLINNKIPIYPLYKTKDMISIFSMILEIPIEKNMSFNDWVVLLYRSGECEYCNFADYPYLRSSEWKILKNLVFETYENKCVECGDTKQLDVDHIKPISIYPEFIDKIENMEILCSICNLKRGNRNDIEYRLST